MKVMPLICEFAYASEAILAENICVEHESPRPEVWSHLNNFSVVPDMTFKEMNEVLVPASFGALCILDVGTAKKHKERMAVVYKVQSAIGYEGARVQTPPQFVPARNESLDCS